MLRVLSRVGYWSANGNYLKKIRKAVIPAAGYGTRLLPITKIIPKELLPIGNKPAIQYVVEEAVAAGVEEIILVCHPSKTEIVDYFKSNADLRSFLESKGKDDEILELEQVESLARFRVVYQKTPQGLGHAILCAEDLVGNEGILGRYYLLPPEIFDDLRTVGVGCRGEFQLTDAIDALAKRRPGLGLIQAGPVFDIGTPQGLVEAYLSIFGSDESAVRP